MNYKEGQAARSILELQKEDGTWGNEFHSFAVPTNKKPLTTEQALRRLQLLGFTIEDEPIQKAVECMLSCLRGERRIDNYWEKTMDWELFTKLMLSTWVKIFDPQNEVALNFAKQWGSVIERAFETGDYDVAKFEETYQEQFYQKTKGPRVKDFVSFYQMNLLQGVLPEETERRMLEYVLNHEDGIYYVYGKKLMNVPQTFTSVETSRYLAAIEILLGYKTAKEKLSFLIRWLEENRDEDGMWDLGAKAKDNVYFPLLDSWRKEEQRKQDCTAKIANILHRLKEK